MPAVSSDGSRVAFTAVGDDRIPHVWIHSLRRSTVTPVQGTEGAAFPFWSPDGEDLGFFAGGRLKRVALVSGQTQELADAQDGRGGSWSREGLIIFAAGSANAIFSVPASGGPATQLTNLEHQSVGRHGWPAFLPDNEHFIYSSIDKNERREIVFGSLRSSEQNVLVESVNSPSSVGPGFLLFAGDDLLLGIRFNLKTLETDRSPYLIAQGVSRGPSGMASFSTAADGSIVVYGRAGTEMVWVDTTGREVAAASNSGAYHRPSLSPSGEQILLSIGGPWLGSGAGVYYVYDSKTDRWRRVIEGIGIPRRPLWTADGTEIIFTTAGARATQIRATRADGSGSARKLFDESAGAFAAATSPQRDLLAVVERRGGPETPLNLRVVSLSGAGGLEASTVWRRTTAWHEYAPAFSSDGLRLAYVSEQSGAPEVFVSELVAQAEPVRVSARGGTVPIWSRDGRQLFYRSPAGLVGVSTGGRPSTWMAHERLIFRAEDLRARSYEMGEFDVAQDGGRFLMTKSPDASRPAQLVALMACGGSGPPTEVP